MVTVRSILTEALNRSNLVSRRQTPPADMTETAYRLLKGIASTYSNDNLLQFIMSDVETTLDKDEFVIGTVDPEAPEEYLAVDIEAPEIHKINRVYWRSKADGDIGNYIEVQYASPEDFDAYPRGTAIYTAQPVNDRQLVLKTKLLADPRTLIKVNYNRKWDFNLDSELRIPEQYVELFTQSLTYKLASTFPRLSTEQVALLKTELDEMIKNVKVATRAVKYLSRTNRIPLANRAAFLSGSMFLPG